MGSDAYQIRSTRTRGIDSKSSSCVYYREVLRQRRRGNPGIHYLRALAVPTRFSHDLREHLRHP